MEETLYDVMYPHQMEQSLYTTLYDVTMRQLYNQILEKAKGETSMNATQPKKFWMITGSGNMPKIRHADMQAAQAEATRLARANPDTEFFILEATEVFHQPLGVVRNRL